MSETSQKYSRSAIAAIGLLLAGGLLGAADLRTYRGFGLGADLATVAKHAEMKPGDAKTIHQRPSLIQELDWQPRITSSSDPTGPDPVRSGALSFYEGKLYRIAITYDRYRVEGLTTADLVEQLSQAYGPAEKPGTEIAYVSNYGEVAKVLARWQDSSYSCDLIRTGDQSSFALVFYAKELDVLAQGAILESMRLDRIDAPQRARDEEKKRTDDEGRAREKARALNKLNFRP